FIAFKKCKNFTFYHWFIFFCPLNPGFIWCRQTSVRTQSGVSDSGKLSGTVVLFIRPCRAGDGAPRTLTPVRRKAPSFRSGI
ncbi:TPA: hypothetical protein ACWO6L_004957, partial [Salmonella enterica subsp. enterica serovar Muenchen]